MNEILNMLKWSFIFSTKITLILFGIMMTIISIIGTISNIRTKNIYGIIISISFFIVALIIFKIT